MAGRIPLTAYLFKRLNQYGAQAVHGVPGDFFLRALDHIKPSGSRWIGNCNELNAGFAADGYARLRGLGALFTTYGVGELSAINAVTGSAAEYVPVVHIVGTPRKAALDSGNLIHHQLRATYPTVYREMYEKVTVKQVNLNNAKNATDQFDEAVRQALIQKQPVYVELPSDMVDEEVDGEALDSPLDLKEQSNQTDQQKLTQIVVERLQSAQRPLIMVDGISARFGLNEDINELVAKSGIPTVTLFHGLGIVNDHHPNYHGVYYGAFAEQYLKEYVNSCDFVLLFGPLLSDINTGGLTAIPNPKITMAFNGLDAKFEGQTYNVSAKTMLSTMLKSSDVSNVIQSNKFPQLPRPQPAPLSPASITDNTELTQDYMWPRLSTYLRPYDTILLANGTPLLGSKLFNLPTNVNVIASGLWYSIGSMLPAAQGVALAQQTISPSISAPVPMIPGGRTILLEGDGSFQTTAQELSTIIRYQLDVTIFLINNDGYAYERLIHGFDADYNDIAPWNYTHLPYAFGAPMIPTGENNTTNPQTADYMVSTYRISTKGELEALLQNETFQTGKGLNFVEVIMGRTDVPSAFIGALKKTGENLRAGKM